MRVARTAEQITQSAWFAPAVVVSIVANAIVIGIETSTAAVASYGEVLAAMHVVLTGVLALELAIRLAAHGPRWRAFFGDAWTRFDLVILAASLMPAVGQFVAIARLARVLRVVRVVSISPKLRLVVATMARSIPSLGHVGLLLGLMLFIYGVLGVHFFREVDPAHWGGLGRALLTLFQILTLEGWVELQEASMVAKPVGVAVLRQLRARRGVRRRQPVHRRRDVEPRAGAARDRERRRRAHAVGPARRAARAARRGRAPARRALS